MAPDQRRRAVDHSRATNDRLLGTFQRFPVGSLRMLFVAFSATFLAAGLNVVPSSASDLIGRGCEGNTIQRTICMENQYKALRPKVEKVYDRLIARIADRDVADYLRKSQSAWQRYVEKQCNLESALVIGTGSSITLPDCKKKMYQARLSYLNSVESDLNELR